MTQQDASVHASTRIKREGTKLLLGLGGRRLDPPTTIIRPPGRFAALNVAEVFRYTELMRMLIARQLRIRYRQTVLGVLWIVLQPLLLMALFSLLFSRVPRMTAADIPYAMFILAGLVPWQFFARSFSEGTLSLMAEENLIQRVYFPRLIVPLVVVVVGIIDLAVPLLLLLVLALIFTFDSLSWNLLYLPMFLLIEVILVLGISLWTAPLNVRFRDVGMLLPFLTMLLMFSSPVVFPLDFLGDTLKQILSFNPLATVIEGSRWAFYGVPFELGWAQIASIAITLAIFVSGLFVFRKLESSISDLY